MKKLFAILLALAMLIPMGTITVGAEEVTAKPDGWYVDKSIGCIELGVLAVGENTIEIELPFGRRRHLPVGPPACVLGFPPLPPSLPPAQLQRPRCRAGRCGPQGLRFPPESCFPTPPRLGVGEREMWFQVAGRCGGGPEGWSPSRYPQAPPLALH